MSTVLQACNRGNHPYFMRFFFLKILITMKPAISLSASLKPIACFTIHQYFLKKYSEGIRVVIPIPRSQLCLYVFRCSMATAATQHLLAASPLAIYSFGTIAPSSLSRLNILSGDIELRQSLWPFSGLDRPPTGL